MSSPRRRRCLICKKGFLPDPRLGDRQRACEEPKCQHELRLRNQAAWRKAHPGYFIARRARERAERNVREPVDPPCVPPPLTRLPWEMAQEESGVAGADFLASLGRMLLVPKSSIRSQPAERTEGSGQVATSGAKSSIEGQLPESPEQSGQVGGG
jgi:hypothetical protein